MDNKNTTQEQNPVQGYSEEEKPIDWMAWLAKLWDNRKIYYITLPIAFLVACIYMLAQPNYYNVTVKLAPELKSGSSASGSLGSLMSSFGLGGGASSGGSDAIAPTLYPDLMNSKAFLVSLFDIPVENKEQTLKTTYFQYLSEHQKAPWWSMAMKSFWDLFPKKEIEEDDKPVNASNLTLKQDGIVKAIGNKIACEVDKKTGIITINVTDQDPVICAAMADSTCLRLQQFITDYRTKKSRQELENIQVQLDKTKAEYEESKQTLAAFNDANWAVVNEDVKLEQQYLQNDMQLKYSAYSAFMSQLISARTKLEESRPVYTVLDGASVPLIKAGPKRGSSVLIFCFLIGILVSVWILRKEFKEQFLS